MATASAPFWQLASLFTTRALPWLLAGLIAALSLWRLVGLEHLLVWHDEVFSLIRVLGHHSGPLHQALFAGKVLTPAQVLVFQHGPPAGWSTTLSALMQHPEHPPLYYLLARALMDGPFSSLTALRGVAAGFGLLLPVAAFWLLHELFGQRPTRQSWRDPLRWPAPWLGALLVAASPMHLLYAQEGRQYALWTLLIIAGSAALVRVLRTRRRADWMVYTALLTLGLHTHLLAVLLIPRAPSWGDEPGVPGVPWQGLH